MGILFWDVYISIQKNANIRAINNNGYIATIDTGLNTLNVYSSNEINLTTLQVNKDSISKAFVSNDRDLLNLDPLSFFNMERPLSKTLQINYSNDKHRFSNQIEYVSLNETNAN